MKNNEKARNEEMRQVSKGLEIYTHINASTINVEMKSAQSSVKQNFVVSTSLWEEREKKERLHPLERKTMSLCCLEKW